MPYAAFQGYNSLSAIPSKHWLHDDGILRVYVWERCVRAGGARFSQSTTRPVFSFLAVAVVATMPVIEPRRQTPAIGPL
jgi:hypothetical protein